MVLIRPARTTAGAAGPLTGHYARRAPVLQGQPERTRTTPSPPPSMRTATFQAGHASSILVTRSTTSGPSQGSFSPPSSLRHSGRLLPPGHSRATSPPASRPIRWFSTAAISVVVAAADAGGDQGGGVVWSVRASLRRALPPQVQVTQQCDLRAMMGLLIKQNPNYFTSRPGITEVARPGLGQVGVGGPPLSLIHI